VRLLRSPTLHFLALGACLLALTRARAGLEVEPLVLDAARVREIHAAYARETGAGPDARAARALVEAAIDEELLLREARARGFAETDPVVRARLARNARFLGEGAATAGDAELAAGVRALGLEDGDLVVRRRLVARMRAELEAEAAPPTLAEVEARWARDRERFRSADRVRLAHVFAARASDAEHVARELARDGAEPSAAAFARGEPFLLGHELAPRSQAELARELGLGFARAVFALPVNEWSGPISSSYGAHAVFVRERLPRALRSFDEARGRIESELGEERAAAALAAGLARLRARQPIRVAEIAP
jgi:peptidyl-prolyl cis-trans isomerase C